MVMIGKPWSCISIAPTAMSTVMQMQSDKSDHGLGWVEGHGYAASYWKVYRMKSPAAHVKGAESLAIDDGLP
jgi:hypothetical protein